MKKILTKFNFPQFNFLNNRKFSTNSDLEYKEFHRKLHTVLCYFAPPAVYMEKTRLNHIIAKAIFKPYPTFTLSENILGGKVAIYGFDYSKILRKLIENHLEKVILIEVFPNDVKVFEGFGELDIEKYIDVSKLDRKIFFTRISMNYSKFFNEKVLNCLFKDNFKYNIFYFFHGTN
jgi:hypothetical protein